MTKPNRVLISVNPKAGRISPMKKAEELRFRLQEKQFDAEVLTDLDEVCGKADAYHSQGELQVVVGVGGDGTAATLVNRCQQGVPVTLLAAGTANLLSKHYKLSGSPKRLAEIVQHGTVKQFDAGIIRCNHVERLFLVMVSCGFDADVVNGVHSQREERYRQGHKNGAHISYFSYMKPIFRSLIGYKFPAISVEPKNGTEHNEVLCLARWAFFFNINRYGWGLPLAPFAKEDDGQLDAVLFRGGTVFHGGFYTALAQCCSLHRFLPSATLQQKASYRLTADVPVPFQLDGDPAGTFSSKTPLEIETVPGRVCFLIPLTEYGKRV